MLAKLWTLLYRRKKQFLSSYYVLGTLTYIMAFNPHNSMRKIFFTYTSLQAKVQRGKVVCPKSHTARDRQR